MFGKKFHHKNLINKNIIYSDKLLQLKDLGNYIKVTSVEVADERLLEKCLNIVFETNPNVSFEAIQYSKKNKKVYFYTDQKLIIKNWDGSHAYTDKSQDKNLEILEEFKNILVSESNKDGGCVSLFDVSEFMNRKNDEYNDAKNQFQRILQYKIKSIYGDSSDIIIQDFDYKNKELAISFKILGNSRWSYIVLAKNGNNLYIKQEATTSSLNILFSLRNELSKFYNKCMEYEDFHMQSSFGINTKNSIFDTDISSNGVAISLNDSSSKNEFKLQMSTYTNDYVYKCNSHSVISTFIGKEDELFKRIYVEIDKCPEWCRQDLIELREKQLMNEQILDREMLLELDKLREGMEIVKKNKEKRLSLKRKLFPFLKK